MKNFKISILKEFKRKGDIFVVLYFGIMFKSKRCMRNGVGRKLDISILKYKFSIYEYKIFSF